MCVDLNPIKAKMSKAAETSNHTSIKIRSQKAKSAHSANHPSQQYEGLMTFSGNPNNKIEKKI
ncbi:MAG: hypothetical protein ACJAYK_002442 [Crocinitomicaceae bacterium]